MPDNSSQLECNPRRIELVRILNNVAFYTKEEIYKKGVEYNPNKPPLLRDKESIRININQIDDINSLTPSAHNHGIIQSDGTVKANNALQANKNIITDNSGNLSVGTILTPPNASTVTPSGDTTNGSIGSNNAYAKADHSHPKSNIYSASNHTHNVLQSDGLVKKDNTIQKSKNLVTDGDGYIDVQDNIVPEGNTVNSNIKMNGANALAGSLATYAKADHVHPSDTSKASSDHSHGILTINGTIQGSSNQNVVTNTNGELAVEDKQPIPTANTTNSNIKMNGDNASAGNLSTYAKADHIHQHDSSKSDIGHKHPVSDITGFPTSMTPTAHSHGIISNTGQLLSNGQAQVDKNVITNSQGFVSYEDKISYNWINFKETHTMSDNIITCYVNPHLRLCFIRLKYEKTDGIVRNNSGNWYNTNITLPKEIGPTWTQPLTSLHPDHWIRVVDDAQYHEDGTVNSDRRKVIYCAKKDSYGKLLASGFYIFTDSS